MELIIALVLFVGMAVCWLVLPGTVLTNTMHQEEELSFTVQLAVLGCHLSPRIPHDTGLDPCRKLRSRHETPALGVR